MDLLQDQFTVIYSDKQVNVEKILSVVNGLGFKPEIIKNPVVGAPTRGEMTPFLQKALARSRTAGKPLFIRFSAHWCGPCQKMSKVTYSDSAVKKELSNFVVLDVDIDQDLETSKALKVGGVPAFVVLGPTGLLVTRTEGFKSPEQFLHIIRNP